MNKKLVKPLEKSTLPNGSAWLVSAVMLVISGPLQAGGQDDPLLGKVMIDQLEVRDADDERPRVLEAQAWLGHDLHKLWFKADVERVDSENEEAELQALYNRAIAPYWDLQLGLRQDFRPEPKRSWAVFGVQGLAPYWFEVDAALFLGESGRSALRMSAEYELMLTQQWVLSPELEVGAYSQNDPDLGTGSGLSDVQGGLRLRYEVRREFAPYIGVNWNRKYGRAADYARQDGEDVEDSQLVFGVRAWF